MIKMLYYSDQALWFSVLNHIVPVQFLQLIEILLSTIQLIFKSSTAMNSFTHEILMLKNGLPDIQLGLPHKWSTQFHLIFLHQNCNSSWVLCHNRQTLQSFWRVNHLGGLKGSSEEAILITKDSRLFVTPVQPTDFQPLKSKLLTLFILLSNCSSLVLSILYYIYQTSTLL